MSDFDTADNARVQDVVSLLTPMERASASPRSLMVRKLTDIVVLPSGRISSNERSLVADILLQVVDKVEIDIRTELAKRIAQVPECPQALLRMLMMDEPVVAGEILTGADNAPEDLLIEVAKDGMLVHREMIAQRKDLSTSVADAVLQYGEVDICKLLLKRDSCALSPKAINQLVAMSAAVPELQALLLRRTELEPAHGFMMFWWVDTDRRRRILTRFALDRALIQDALADLYERVFRSNEPDELVKEILIFAERRHRPRGANGEQVPMDVIIRTITAACKDAPQEIIEAVGLIAGISSELAARILRDPGGEPIAILCKSIGMPRDDFFAIFHDPTELNGAKEKKAEYLLGIFDSMARDFSRAVLRYWGWEGNPRIAHIKCLLNKAEDGIEDGAY